MTEKSIDETLERVKKIADKPWPPLLKTGVFSVVMAVLLTIALVVGPKQVILQFIVAVVLCLAVVMALLCLTLFAFRDFSTSSGKATVRMLKNMEQVRDSLIETFKMHEDGDILQTFVGAHTIAGGRDYCQYITPAQGLEVIRYFIITNPREINFAAHSKGATNTWEKIAIKNYYWHDQHAHLLPDIFTNITMFPKETMLTFSSKDKQDASEKALMFDPKSKDVIGLGITSGEVVSFIHNNHLRNLHKTKPKNLEEIKKESFDKNPVKYLLAVCHSIAKEVSAYEPFNPLLDGTPPGYIGIVGSFASILNGDSRNMDGDSIEIDLLMFLPKEKLQHIESVYDLAGIVARRYSIADTLTVAINEEMSPIHRFRDGKAQKYCEVQLIINDINFEKALPPSLLIMNTRLSNNYTFTTREQLQLANYYKLDGRVNSSALLHEPFGLYDLKKQIENNTVRARNWDFQKKRMIEKHQSMDSEVAKHFYKYATKWSAYNYLNIIKGVYPVERSTEQLLRCVLSGLSLGSEGLEKLLVGEQEETLAFIEGLIKDVESRE